MLWLKAFHIIFVVSWFAGLFYLPRLFIYHAESTDALSHERFKLMERRLLLITHIGGSLALLFGVLLLMWWIGAAPDYFKQGWLHAKLTLVLALIGYHAWLMRLVVQFREGRNTKSSRWLRLFNEIPSVILIAVVLLVVVKPF